MMEPRFKKEMEGKTGKKESSECPGGDQNCKDCKTRTKTISPGALLKEPPKDECADCTDDKRCLMEAGVLCGKGETV